MKYKSLLVLSLAVVMTSCKMAEIQDNISISGYWAQLNSVSQAKSFVRFDKGLFYTYSLPEALTVVNGTVWGYDEDEFKESEVGRCWYSIDGGVLQIHADQNDRTGQVSVSGDKLTWDGVEYVSVKSFREANYSRIQPEKDRISLSYAAESEAIKVKITNPLPNAIMKAETSTQWIRNLLYSNELLSFDVAEVQALAAGTITLSYPGAEDVRLVVSRSSGIRIVVDKQDLSYGYKSQSVSLGYRITGADASARISAEKEPWNATWLKNLNVSDGFISFELDENNTGETRAATIRLHTQYADDVTISLSQLSSSTSISLAPSYENTDYKQKSLSFRFSIKDPQEGRIIEAVTSESWITDISVTGNTLYYKVSENEGFLSRSGRIELSYGTLAAIFTINQTADVINLSSSLTANCYIVTGAGKYKFRAVKGNGSESVGDVASCDVLWETFGTKETPASNDLITEVLASDGYIMFGTNVTYRKGNASIAAKDASGKILWSWHIWFTDYPKEQVYYKGAGTMMDRNLGAVSATPGDIGANGLYYQWGRKDPFVGVGAFVGDSYKEIKSSPDCGTIEFAVAHPTTFIERSKIGAKDWYYTVDGTVDNTRWQSHKTIYDPCPAGWRVPDGGWNSPWRISYWSRPSYVKAKFDSENKGVNCSGIFSSEKTVWYPASGLLLGYVGDIGEAGYYWSVTPYVYESGFAYYTADEKLAFILHFYCYSSDFSDLRVSTAESRYCGNSVRCQKE